MALQARFQAAVKKVSNGELSNLSQNDQLDLYGLYAVVNKGVAPSEGPSAYLDPRGFAKWTAWTTQSHLSKEEAMGAYIELVGQLESEKSTSGNGGGGGSNPFENKASTGFTMSNGNDEAVEEDICYYATKGDVNTVKRLLKEDKDLVNFRDQDGLTPLMRAVDRNEEAVVELLVKSGADLNATDGEGQTALHYAVYCEHTEMAGMLVLYGAQTDIQDADGMTAVDAAGGETKEVLMQAIDGSWRQTGKWRLDFSELCKGKEVALGVTACALIILGVAWIRHKGRSR